MQTLKFDSPSSASISRILEDREPVTITQNSLNIHEKAGKVRSTSVSVPGHNTPEQLVNTARVRVSLGTKAFSTAVPMFSTESFTSTGTSTVYDRASNSIYTQPKGVMNTASKNGVLALFACSPARLASGALLISRILAT
jgi:hypothetical protein